MKEINAKMYRGFGEVHGLREWARLLNVNKDTLRYQLTEKKLTIEDFAEKKGIAYKPQLDEGRQRVNRMAQAEELILALFDRSGYEPEVVKMERIPGLRELRVFWADVLVGVYRLDTGAIILAPSGEGINLIDFPVAAPRIIMRPNKAWEAHPETRKALVDRILAGSNYDPEIAKSVFENSINLVR